MLGVASLLLAAALDVPFLPQSEYLCGGAAAAMVYRFWGEPHADAKPFEPLIDRRAGGIETRALTARIAADGWQTTEFVGSVARLGDEIARGHPVVILIADRPRRLHFVVVTSVGADGSVGIHDPSRGPGRRLSSERLVAAWRPAGFWSLLILPPATGRPASRRRSEPATSAALSCATDPLNHAIDEIATLGLDHADAALGDVRAMCPNAPEPVRELAGVRFAQRRWADAAALARESLGLAKDAGANTVDPYATDVLASSLYMQGSVDDALRAWNTVGKPLVNLVHVSGLRNLRYQVVAEALAVEPNTVLTPDRLWRARRRLGELPNILTSRVVYRIERDGYATVDVAVVERAASPGRSPGGWASVGVRSAIDQQIDLSAPAASDQGAMWSGTWRYGPGRPGIALSLAAPHVGALPGVWRVAGGWDEQTYLLTGSVRSRETHAFSRLSVSDWFAPNWKYEAQIGLDVWNGARQAGVTGIGVERRLLDDRLSVGGRATLGAAIGDGASFATGALRSSYRSSIDPAPWVVLASGGVDLASTQAPLSLWSAAGDGHMGEHLLRAHPTLHDGAVATDMFGRHLTYATTELRRWLDTSPPLRVGVGTFVDVAHVGDRPSPRQTDVGAGLRIKLPGVNGAVRVDAAYGIGDAARALTIGLDVNP